VKFKISPQKICTSLVVCWLFISCGSEDSTPDTPAPSDDFTVSELVLADALNNNNASDLKVKFSQVNDASQVSEYRIYIMQPDQAAGFNLATAESLDPNQYLALSGDKVTYAVNLDIETKTISGATISNNQEYNVFVLTVMEDAERANALSQASNTVQMSNSIYVETFDIPGLASTDGISIDAEGNIYTSVLGPTGNGSFDGTQILKYNPLSGELNTFSDNLDGPLGHAFDNEGNLLVSNINGETISKIDINGDAETYLSNAELTGGDITFDKEGIMYHSVYEKGLVLRIDLQKNISTVASGEMLDSPLGIVVLDDGDLIVANFFSGDIVRVHPDGEQELVAALPTSVGYICKINNTLFATGWSSHKIYRITLSGQVSELFQSASGGNKDGGATTASFLNPNGIESSADGKYLYITQSNRLLRRIALPQ
jgi:sugar lactone lactonase YvrE